MSIIANAKSKLSNRSLTAVFKNEAGAIDLASIMVGIIVIGLIGGVIAATVFAVIPWTQDNAAKQQLDAIDTAQSAFSGIASESGSPRFGNLTDSSSDLPTAGWMAASPDKTYCSIATGSGESAAYTSYVKSASGKVYSKSSADQKAATVPAAQLTACLAPVVTVPAASPVPTSDHGWVSTVSLSYKADENTPQTQLIFACYAPDIDGFNCSYWDVDGRPLNFDALLQYKQHIYNALLDATAECGTPNFDDWGAANACVQAGTSQRLEATFTKAGVWGGNHPGYENVQSGIYYHAGNAQYSMDFQYFLDGEIAQYSGTYGH
jgi:type II secretory pathway pseudopilin PulG